MLSRSSGDVEVGGLCASRTTNVAICGRITRRFEPEACARQSFKSFWQGGPKSQHLVNKISQPCRIDFADSWEIGKHAAIQFTLTINSQVLPLADNQIILSSEAVVNNYQNISPEKLFSTKQLDDPHQNPRWDSSVCRGA